MSLQDGRGRLYSALKTLQSHWDRTEPHWRDALKADFVEQILTPLHELTDAALGAVDQMDVVLHRLRRDCEGDSFDIHGGSDPRDEG
jgi:hypothetical protein